MNQQYEMSAVVYDIGYRYDTRMIKTRKNMVTVRPQAAIKEKKNFARYRLTKKYQDFKAH